MKDSTPMTRYVIGYALTSAAAVITLIFYLLTPAGSHYVVFTGLIGSGIGLMISGIYKMAKQPTDLSAINGGIGIGTNYSPYSSPIEVHPPAVSKPILLALLAVIPVAAAIVIVIISIAGRFPHYADGCGCQVDDGISAAQTNIRVGTPVTYQNPENEPAMPSTMGNADFMDAGNGIAIKAEKTQITCREYSGCFRFLYTQYNTTCTRGITVTIEEFNANNIRVGTTTQSAGLSDQVAAIEFPDNLDGQTTTTNNFISAACA